MKFIKYPSIENTYRQEFIDKIIEEQKAGGVWVVTKKIHGANFSLWCDGTQVRMAKRTALLSDDDDFFGVQRIKEDLYKKVTILYEVLNACTKHHIEQIAVYGELYGGSYDHPEVARDLNAHKVQKGVCYSPNNHFVAVDIRVDDKFLDFEMMQDACKDVGLPCIPALMYGSMGDCLEFQNDFQSTVAGWFGLPEIKGNICEGVVIRPCKTQFLFSHKRVMLKSKNDKFKEKGRKPKKVRVKQQMSKQGEKVLKSLLVYVTDNRYDAVVSKIGKVTPKDFGKIQGEFAKDVLEEFKKDKKYKRYTQLEKDERKVIHKTLNHEIAKVVKKILVMGIVVKKLIVGD